MTSEELSTLRSVAARLIPADALEPEGGPAALPYLLRELAPGGAAPDFASDLSGLLACLNTAGAFSGVPPSVQDLLLDRCAVAPETGMAFHRLAELITDGFYTSPAGMAMIGFTAVGRVAR